MTLPENSYDDHTVEATLEQIKRITGNQPKILIDDRGYRGKKEFGKSQWLTSSVPLKSDSQYDQRR